MTGELITTTPDKIIKAQGKLPETRIIAVHIDTVNHCFVKRTDLRKGLLEKNLNSKILIPADGEVIKT